MLKNFLKQFDSDDFALDGFFNVEGGHFAIATDYFEECDEEHIFDSGPDIEECRSACGRTSSTFLVGHAGDGDGVYTTWRLRIGDDKTAGFLAIFDSGYELANYALESLEEHEWTSLPLELLEKFGSTKAHKLGTFESAKKLLIGDSLFSKGGGFPAVDFAYGDDRDFEIFSFVESPGEQLGAVPNESRHLTRVLVAIASDHVRDLIKEEFPPHAIDLKKEFVDSLWEIQMSHQQTQSHTIGSANFDVKNVSLEHLGAGHIMTAFQAWSWLLWDLQFGYRTASDVAGALKSMGFEGDADMLSVPCSLRGIEQVENLELVNELNRIFEKSNTPANTPTKSSLGGLSSSQELPRFCSNCGTQFAHEDKFCASCGNARF